jgi:nitroreductase
VPAVLDLSADELLSTTRAVRKRLDLDRPVARETVRECLELALQAPNGSNAQIWRFLVVEDPGLRGKLADIYRRSFDLYREEPFAAGNIVTGEPVRDAAQRRVMDSAVHLAEHLHRVPVLVIPCLAGFPAAAADRFTESTLAGSLAPAAWSFCLAARSRGLGTAWTTLHLRYEEEAAAVLGVPYETTRQLALIAVAHTRGTDFRPAHREPVDSVVTFYPA